MVVCSCNFLTEAEIRSSLRQPDAPRCARDVYASLGCAPVCGGCSGAIAKLVEEARKEDVYLRANTLQKVAA